MTPQVAPHLLGRSGEDEAAAWYAAHGYEVLARNWRCRAGELDLIVARGRLVVFCEVKSRSSARFVSSVRVVTFKDVNVEELPAKDL